MFRVLMVQSHYGRKAKATWQPFNTEDREYLGWCTHTNGNEEEPTFTYFVPDLDAETPTILVYQGSVGDPQYDTLIQSIAFKEGS